jgi:hypothetical protein
VAGTNMGPATPVVCAVIDININALAHEQKQQIRPAGAERQRQSGLTRGSLLQSVLYRWLSAMPYLKPQQTAQQPPTTHDRLL